MDVTIISVLSIYLPTKKQHIYVRWSGIPETEGHRHATGPDHPGKLTFSIPAVVVKKESERNEIWDILAAATGAKRKIAINL